MFANIMMVGPSILASFCLMIIGICMFAVIKFSSTYESSGFVQFILKPQTIFEGFVSCLGALSALAFLWGSAMLVVYLLFLFALG